VAEVDWGYWGHWGHWATGMDIGLATAALITVLV